MVWWLKATRAVGIGGGSFTGGPPKGVIHTTEGRTYAGALAAYRANNSWPHFTCSYEGGQFRAWQHNPVNVASRALRNLSGGAQTNRDFAIQIELVGTVRYDLRGQAGWLHVEDFPNVYLDGVAELIAWIEQNAGVPRRCSVTFKPYPNSYGTNNGVRLSGPMWDGYTGWLAHQNVPENLHGDAGLINIGRLLQGGIVPDLRPWAMVKDPSVMPSGQPAPEENLLKSLLPVSSPQAMAGEFRLSEFRVVRVNPASLPPDVPGWSICFGFSDARFESHAGNNYYDTVRLVLKRLGLCT